MQTCNVVWCAAVYVECCGSTLQVYVEVSYRRSGALITLNNRDPQNVLKTRIRCICPWSEYRLRGRWDHVESTVVRKEHHAFSCPPCERARVHRAQSGRSVASARASNKSQHVLEPASISQSTWWSGGGGAGNQTERQRPSCQRPSHFYFFFTDKTHSRLHSYKHTTAQSELRTARCGDGNEGAVPLP